MKTTLRQFLIAGLCLASLGCSDEMEFQESVYIHDPENPGLPKYTELGYNTFGAYLDRKIFESDDQTPMKVFYEDGITSVTLDGRFGTDGRYGSDRMSITLKMNDFAPDEYTDLIALDQVSIDLTNSNNYSMDIVIEPFVFEEGAEIIEGTFQFKRAQNLLVDKQQIGVILSGTFEFRALVNGVPITVSNGRFDVNVGESNFYVF